MNAKWTILGKKFATLCILPLAAVSGCMSLNAPDRADNSKGAENMQVRIAELEILPEWLDAYLEAAGAVGAESVAKEPGVVCIFPMQKKESPTSEGVETEAARRRTSRISRRRISASTRMGRRT